MAPLGFEAITFQLHGTALPARVWASSNTTLHRGGIHIWVNLVFIHYWVLLKNLRILRIHWGVSLEGVRNNPPPSSAVFACLPKPHHLVWLKSGLGPITTCLRPFWWLVFTFV